ncbi:MAG: helix-turn-helix domain-containing protein [Christensenellaceae bacterium]|jgi:transcriptional regulator with XRE-family HTH domain|nr:helix-turn-helix domain-containing protein [Christensenellaceae bacterium]
MANFAERLTEVLKEQNMSQTKLARILKVSPNTVSRWCSHNAKPDIDMLVLIAKALNESADYLLGIAD